MTDTVQQLRAPPGPAAPDPLHVSAVHRLVPGPDQRRVRGPADESGPRLRCRSLRARRRDFLHRLYRVRGTEHSDAIGERRWHVAIPAFAGAAGFALSGYLQQPILALAALSLAALGIWGALGPFWTLPTAFLSGSAAAAGIALINSVGNVGGFVGPYLLGFIRRATNSFADGMFLLAGMLALAGVLAITVRHSEAATGAATAP